MRAFGRTIQRRQIAARSQFIRQTTYRGFASVNNGSVNGLTVIDHHYEYIFPFKFHACIVC